MPFLALLGNKYAMYAMAALALVGIYFAWKNNVEQAALMEYNQKQMEQVIHDQQLFQQKMDEVQNNQKAIVEDLAKKNDELTQKLTDLNTFLDSTEAKKEDKPSSTLLRSTIKQLRIGQ
jgi:Tfp pilus assembly protein PilN